MIVGEKTQFPKFVEIWECTRKYARQYQWFFKDHKWHKFRLMNGKVRTICRQCGAYNDNQ